MKSVEEMKNLLSLSNLPYKYDAIQYLEEHETMKNMLCGQCWACKHGEPYRKRFSGVFDENFKLTVCSIGKHDEGTIAKTNNVKCDFWELKHE